MNSKESLEVLPAQEADCQASDITIAQLVGEVYEAVPAVEKIRLLEQLLRPLGVLALVAVANGIFARIRFRGGWPQLHVRLEDTHQVRASDVITLVDYVQQVSVDAVDGLAHLLAGSPTLAGSAAAALLVTVLTRRAQTRRATDHEGGLASAQVT